MTPTHPDSPPVDVPVRESFDGPFLACAADVIERECADRTVKQKSVALTYALALRAEAIGGMPCDWPRANRAILARWSARGLDRIKSLAWKYVEGKVRP